MSEQRTNPAKLADEVKRDADGAPCPSCGGYADRVEITPEENKEYGCGRTYACCARAFVCRVCKTRIVGSAEAPEVGW